MAKKDDKATAKKCKYQLIQNNINRNIEQGPRPKSKPRGAYNSGQEISPDEQPWGGLQSGRGLTFGVRCHNPDSPDRCTAAENRACVFPQLIPEQISQGISPKNFQTDQ